MADLPALPRLIYRQLDENPGVEFVCSKLAWIAPIHGKGPAQTVGNYASSKYTKAVIGAIVKAGQSDFSAVVILIDRDRRKTQETILPLKEGRDSLRHLGYPPCAVGCAVETFDAWMICDPKAIETAGGEHNKHHPSPESLQGNAKSDKHPKNVAKKIFGTPRGVGLGQKYAVVAAGVRLDHLKKSCPKGFNPFADEISERITPVISS